MALSLWTNIKLGLATVILVGTGIVLAPAPPPVQTKPNRIPVTFWHMWTGEWQPVVENICKRFNESQDVYEMIPLSVPSSGAETKFLLSVSGGNPPDLVSQWNPVLGMWAEKGLLTPVEDLMTPSEKKYFMDNAYPIIKKHAIYKGKIYAVIAGIDVSAVYYRLDHLKEVGVDQDHLPQTLEDLVALGRKLDKRDKDGHLRRIGFIPQHYRDYVPSFGGTFGGSNELIVNSPEVLRTLTFINDSVKQVGYENITRFAAGLAADNGASAPLIAGNYSIMLDGQWRVKQAKQYAPDLQYVVAPLPPPRGGKPLASMTDPNLMLVPRGAKHSAGAWAFLKWWMGYNDPNAAGQCLADMGWLPFCDRIAKSEKYQNYLKTYPQFKVFVDLMSSPNLQIPPQGPLQSFVIDQITKTDESTMRGTLTPAAALERMQHQVTAEETRQRRLGHIK